MTNQAAITMVREYGADAQISLDQMIAAFVALYGREPNQTDWANGYSGVWSLCRAAAGG